MRIYDNAGKTQLDEVTLFLTPEEARELGDTARQLADAPDHSHVADLSQRRQITVVVYTSENLADFTQEARDVISDRSE